MKSMTLKTSYHSKKELEIVRTVNLGEFLEDYDGSATRFCHSYHRHSEHDSLVFRENRFYHNSKGIHGDSIEYLTKTYKVSFPEAVSMLLNYHNGKRFGNATPVVKTVTRSKKKKSSDDETETVVCTYQNTEIRRTYAYLYKKRRISHEVIKMFEERGYLWEDEFGNACFQVRDYHTNKPLGYMKRGTYKDSTYKSISAGLKDTCFNIAIGDIPNRAYIFESVIDLMSYVRLFAPQNCILFAMGGVKLNQAYKALDTFNLSDVTLCVDNDEAGDNFIHNMQGMNTVTPKYDISIDRPDKVYKDWNKQLTSEPLM